ncbi:MAG: hypothetical protein AB7G11_09410 [Phycisphaerales bacterium]
MSIHWVEEEWEVPPASELEQMRKSVAGHPNHPDRMRLEQFERRIRGTPDRLQVSVWAGGSGKWRYCRQPISADGSPGPFRDVASNGNVAWCLLPGSATVVSLSKAPPPGRDFASVEPMIQRRLSMFFFGGLGELSALHPTVKSFVLDSQRGSWEARAATEFGSSLKATGTWDPSAGNGSIERVELFAPSQPTPNTVITARGPRLSLTTNNLPAVASEVEILLNGRRATRLVNVHIEEGSPRLAEVIRPPSAGSHVDPIRGEQVIASFADYRTGEQTDTVSAASGTETRTTPLLDVTRGPSYLKYAGWIVGILVLVGTIAWYLARRKRAQIKEYK